MRSITTAFFACVALTGGCAAVHPRERFAAVQDDVAVRVGQQIHWHDHSPADAEADAKVALLLGRPLDANSAVQVALLNNRRLQATYESLGIAQADLVAAGLLRNPIFDAAYKFGDGGATAKIDLGLSFDFVDLLFIGARKKIAAAELATTQARVTAAVLDMTGRVRVAFYDCQATAQAVDLRRQIADATAASADLARRLREAGNTTELAYANEQALHIEAQLALDAAEAEAAAAHERLTALLGIDRDDVPWTVAGRLPEPSTPEPAVGGMEDRAIARSLDLAIARSTVTAAYQSLGIAVPLGLLSELETGVSAEREDGVWYTGPSVALPVPLFSQGQPAAARAAALVRQAEANVYATVVDVRSGTRAAFVRVAALRKQADTIKSTLLPLRERVVRQTQLHYNAMQIGAFELLTAKRDQIETAANYLVVLRDYWSAKADLELILAGRLPGRDRPFGSSQMNTDERR